MSNSTPEPGNRSLHTCGRRILGLLDEGHSPEIGTEPGGRPFFTDRHADFSISHSRSMAAVAYSTEKNRETGCPLRTGCDIQHVKPLKDFGEIARLQFSPEEQEYIVTADGPEKIDRFYRIWVLKECFLKACGLSVFDMRTAPSFANAGGLAAEVNEPLNFFLYELGEGSERYMLAAARIYCPPPEFRWFSDPLPFKSIAAIKAVVNPVNTVSPKT